MVLVDRNFCSLSVGDVFIDIMVRILGAYGYAGLCHTGLAFRPDEGRSVLAKPDSPSLVTGLEVDQGSYEILAFP